MAGKVSAKQAAIAVLSRAGKPMAVKEIVAEVLAMPGVKLGGKTPGATIAAQLYTGSEFKKAGRGMIALTGKAAKPTPRPRLKQTSKKATTKKAAAKPTERVRP